MAVQVEATREIQKNFDPRRQKTLKTSVSTSGIGLFTAEKGVMTLHPTGPNAGIVFIRSDLPERPQLCADLDHVVGTPRCTILGNECLTIQTVEHVLAALKGMQIDNALIELNGPEVPIMDGSSEPFVELIQKAGVEELDSLREILQIESPISWSKGDVHLVAIPSDTFKVSYVLHYPESTLLCSQYLSSEITPEYFAHEIAPCRTFCLYEEITPFVESGLIKGGGLDNAIIIKDDVIINPDGIRFSDEMVRHKILDLIGDLSLIPVNFTAHIIAIRSGHASNVAFAGALHNHIEKEKASYGAT